MATRVQCPKCRSVEIEARGRGFNPGKAAEGAIVKDESGLPPLFYGTRDIDVYCLNCGHKWNPIVLEEERGRAKANTLSTSSHKWKSEFYKAYDSGNMESALALLEIYRSSMLKQKGLDGTYFHLKSEDGWRKIIIVSISILAVIIFFVVGSLLL
ncbi:hypothetical protein [Dyadobacter bucti]|jgi:hypothetical protein|uniref:hypothetical protein n=1 Tax=Dyadobacter bucti TaxID=2572203 RepID=UPI003F6F995D